MSEFLQVPETRSGKIAIELGESTMTIKDVSDVLGIKEQSIRQMLSHTRNGRGDFPIPQKVNGKNVWEPSVIEAYRIKRSQTSTEIKPAVVEKTSPKVAKVKNIEIVDDDNSNGLLDLKEWQLTEGKQNKSIIDADYAIEACKPDALEFIRVNDRPEWRIRLALVEYRPKNEYWIVRPEIVETAGKNSEIGKYQVYLVINEFGRLMLWPVKEGRGSWPESRRIAVKTAVKRWVRVKADVPKKEFYTVDASEETVHALGEPKWPTDLTMQEIVSSAFGNRVIGDHNHFLLRKLQGKKRSKAESKTPAEDED